MFPDPDEAQQSNYFSLISFSNYMHWMPVNTIG